MLRCSGVVSVTRDAHTTSHAHAFATKDTEPQILLQFVGKSLGETDVTKFKRNAVSRISTAPQLPQPPQRAAVIGRKMTHTHTV